MDKREKNMWNQEFFSGDYEHRCVEGHRGESVHIQAFCFVLC